jgi:hypothetical protein
MQRSIKHIDELIRILYNNGSIVTFKEWEEFCGDDSFIYNFEETATEQIRNNLIDILGKEELIFKLEEEILKSL